MELGLNETSARESVIAWATAVDKKPQVIYNLKGFLKANGSDFLNPDSILYEFCSENGAPAQPGAFDGFDGVGDFLAEFAEKNERTTKQLDASTTYDVFRLGSIYIRGKEKPDDTSFLYNKPHYELTIWSNTPSSPHVSFEYIDTTSERADKPESNKTGWHGRVVATNDALYLTGTAMNEADAAMLILWPHPSVEDMLVGVQFAKLAPERDAQDKRHFTITRRVAAVRKHPGRRSVNEVKAIDSWLWDEPLGVVVRIDKPTTPESYCD